MKKIYLFFLIVLFSGSNAQIVNIPDANFKAKLLSANSTNGVAKNAAGQNMVIDVNSNGEIEITEALNVYRLEFYFSGITGLTGLEQFTNLTHLRMGSMDVPTLDFSALTNLQVLYISGFPMLTNLSVSNLNNLNNLEVRYCTNLATLSVQNLNSLNHLTVNTNNNLNNLIFSNFPLLTAINCTSNNNLDNITVANCPLLLELDLGNNSLITLNTSNLPLVNHLIVQFNNLSTLNTGMFPKLSTLSVVENLLTALDLSLNPLLYAVYLANNNLQNINIKNGGSNFPYYFTTDNNSQLTYVCCDADDQDMAESKLAQSGNYNTVVNSYCNFSPGGQFYTVQGETRYDFNSDGCMPGDLIVPHQKIKLTTGIFSVNFNSTIFGSYLFPVQAGTHIITPVLENPTYFTISPANITANFPTQTSPLTQNFCLTANGNHNDLETAIIPITAAVPGFTSKYKIIYKNKGTAAQSGSLAFSYDDNLMNLVSSTVAPASQTTGSLNWNFTNLLPFETREVTVTFTLNTPIATPPLTGGQILNYTTQVTGATDETPTDNSFILNQTVVNSFDPNDKTCLQGTAIAQAQVGDYVHYLIRFENTGTANAQNVVVKDIIDTSKFNLSSLVAVGGSHSFVTRITGPNTVEFIFENIQLPFADATNDGYVVFKIKTLATLTVGNAFSNTANIYFDYNAPIVTNTYTTTVQSNLSTAETVTENFSIYPNPVKDVLHFKTKERIVKAEVYDLSGRIVRSSGITQNAIDLSELPKGNYLIRIYTKDQIIIKKLIKE